MAVQLVGELGRLKYFNHIGDINEMVIMKLYTEEQVREAIAQGYDWCQQKYMPSDNMIEIFIRQFKPIELPSDEEIHEESDNYVDNDHVLFVTNSRNSKRYGFSDGAKWMRNKILNK